MNLLKILVFWLAKYYRLNLGKLVFEIITNNKSLIKILIEIRAQHKINEWGKE